jgi:hypothetical protein
MTIPPPIQIETPLTVGTQVSSSHPFTISWNGASTGTMVKITVSFFGFCQEYFGSPCSVVAYAEGSAGSYTFMPSCAGNTSPNEICTIPGFGPESGNVYIDVFPASGYATEVNARGVTGGMHLSWDYHYEFDDVEFGI